MNLIHGLFCYEIDLNHNNMIQPMEIPMPEKWENSRVNPSMSIGESIIHSVIQAPQDEATKRWNKIREEKLWKKRGSAPMENTRNFSLEERSEMLS